MHTLFLRKNPFYILEVSPKDKRANIIEKAEEKAFFSDSSSCEEAQAELFNPIKRLSAELDWFCGVSDEKISDIYNSINHSREISTDGMFGISKLNATLHNFSIIDYNDYFEIGYAILDIDEQYNDIDLSELTETINVCHEQAGMRAVTELEVEQELNKKRDKIRQLFAEKIQKLNDNDYIELITMIAEKCIADDDYEDGIIISDIVDQYEVKMQSVIEEASEEIFSHIDIIKELSNDEEIEENLTDLITQVKKWDRLVQPLQLKSMASGLSHNISEKLGFEIRDLALYLHNEKGLTEESLRLVTAMKEVFAELGNLSDIFEDDSEVLTEIMEGGKDAKEIIAELDELKSMANKIGFTTTSKSVDDFILKVKLLNLKIKSSSLDQDSIIKVKESIGYIVRGATVSLHNDYNQTSYALRISSELVNEFSDIQTLYFKLIEDFLELNQQAALQNRIQKKAKRSKILKFLVPVGIFLIIMLIIGLSECDSSKYSHSSSSESVFSQNSPLEDKVYIDIVSIKPSIGIRTNTSVENTEVVCECKTVTEETVWVYMSVYEYNTYIDSTADISSNFSTNYKVIEYSTEKRIHGTARLADSICDDLSEDTDTIVLEFSSID